MLVLDIPSNHLNTEYNGKQALIKDELYLHFFPDAPKDANGSSHDNGCDGNCHNRFYSTLMLIFQGW